MEDLRDTIIMMTSSDYKERFIAEWLQTKIRYKKLFIMVQKFQNGKLDFRPDCPLVLLESQLKAMESYLRILEDRAWVEKIDLPFDPEREVNA